jgi:hypothetical protein
MGPVLEMVMKVDAPEVVALRLVATGAFTPLAKAQRAVKHNSETTSAPL